MYDREMEERLAELASQYPVVTVTGPRQSGKTTLVRKLFSNKPYANLERLDVQELATSDPRAFLEQYPDGAILDEIQRAPSLLSYIQVMVDEADREGMFILTGSHQIQLREAVSQSLAGRTALLTLLPMSIGELESMGIERSLEAQLLQGGFPRIFKKDLDPITTYRDYLQNYLERDLSQLMVVKELEAFHRFMRLCAGRIGQLLNIAGLAADVGVSAPTIKGWLAVLEASFLIVRIPPYFENFGKRLVKRSKLYFTDVGLACSLLGIETENQVSRDPLYGALVENLVLLELLKKRLNMGRDPRLFYFRDVTGYEVDFIYQQGHELVPIEVKGGKTFHRDYFVNLEKFHHVSKGRAIGGYLVYAGDLTQKVGNSTLINYRSAASIV